MPGIQGELKMLIQCQAGSHLSPGVRDPGEWDVWAGAFIIPAFFPEKEKGLAGWEQEAC